MDGVETRSDTQADTSNLRFREQLENAAEARGDCTLPCQGTLEISADEDVGGDPYNRRGSFKKVVR